VTAQEAVLTMMIQAVVVVGVVFSGFARWPTSGS